MLAFLLALLVVGGIGFVGYHLLSLYDEISELKWKTRILEERQDIAAKQRSKLEHGIKELLS